MLPDLESGGVEQGTLELAEYLAHEGHKSLVISRGGRMVADLEAKGSTHILLPFIGEKSPRPLLHLPFLRKLFTRVDVVHLRSRVPAWAGFLAWKSLPEEKRPLLVTTFHGIYSINAYSAVMGKGERVIAVSKGVEEHIREHYKVPPERLVCIPRGADTRRFDPSLFSGEEILSMRRGFACDDDTVLILLPGRFTRIKGQDLVLRALQNVSLPKWKLLLVGDPAENPGYAEELRGFAETLGDHVVFTGYRKDIPALLAASDFLISPSRKPEAFGRILAEAAMMERAVIASAHGGSLEIVADRETGLLFESENVEDLAEKIEILARDKTLRDKMGKGARIRVLEKFTTQKMCESTVAFYEAALQEKARTAIKTRSPNPSARR